MAVTLSIIIPIYNAEPYIRELLDLLSGQITDEVEVILVDDGSRIPFETDYEWAKVFRQDNKGASSARNKGLELATGKYIAFIDADDLVSENYVEKIIEKIKAEAFDYMYLSWRAFGGWNMDVKLNSLEDTFPPFNLCVWNRIYKRSVIGNVRFNEKKACAEDAQFIRDVKEEGKKKAFISEYMYFYRADAKDSLTKRARNGEVDTTRIVYYFPKVTKDMTYLIDEFKELDADSEVILMTPKNELSELSKHAMVVYPQKITGTELRGEFTPLFTKVNKPLKTQVLIYVSALYRIGGIETWTYNFCSTMSKYYDLMVLFDKSVDEMQKRRLAPFADIVKNTNAPIMCDFAINCRAALLLPKNVRFKHYYKIIHTCKMRPEWKINNDSEKLFFVSKAARDSWEEEGEVIYNLTKPVTPRKALLLVSACRLSWEKGENRINDLASLFHKLGILFTWIVFTDSDHENIIEGVIYRKPTLEIRSYIQKADFYVSLSNEESFGYSMVEALELGVPLLTTPLKVLPEIGFKEGVNGFTIPFKVSDCDNLLEIVNSDLKGFEYKRDNASIVRKWRDVFGDMTPTRNKIKEGHIYVVANISFKEMNGMEHEEGSIFLMDKKRAKNAKEQGFIDIIG